MSKTKINLKLIITLFGVALVMCLVPLGVQALATDEATDAAATNNEGEPAAPANVTTIKFESDYTDDLFTPNDERTFTLDEGDTIISDVVEHVGYLFIVKAGGERTCIAAAFFNDLCDKQFKEFKD